MATPAAITPAVQKLYDRVQSIKDSTGKKIPEICKQLKVEPGKYYYARSVIYRHQGKDGRKKVAEKGLAKVEKKAARSLTIVDLGAKTPEVMPAFESIGNGPAVVIMTDARSAFAWAASLMKG